MPFKLEIDKSEEIEWVNTRRVDAISFKDCHASLKIIDLFSGCGGLTLGLQRAAEKMKMPLSVKFAIDLDQDSLSTYKANFGNISENILCDDILNYFDYKENSDLSAKELKLRENLGPIDILVAGPPCQGHSDLNNHSRRDDPRNRLYLSCLQAIKITRPQFVIIENVPTVIHSKENVVNITKNVLIKIGYYLKELKVDFLRLGIPQTRKRHIMIASFDQELIESIETDYKNEYNIATLEEFINDYEILNENSLINKQSKISEKNQARIEYLFTNDVFDLPDKLRPNCHRNKKHSYKSNYGRLHLSKPAQTITSGFSSMGQGRYVHPNYKRTLIPREAARIQGFPDFFSWQTNSLTSLRRMIANAVPPQLTFQLGQFYIERNTNLVKVTQLVP